MVIDPPATEGNEACTVLVAARIGDQAVLLADRSVRGAPELWTRAATEAAAEFAVSAVLMEDQPRAGWIMALLAAAGLERGVTRFHLPRGRRARAEVAAYLYGRGRVVHGPGLELVEIELLTTGQSLGWRERADAAIAAVIDLLPIDPTVQRAARPALRW